MRFLSLLVPLLLLAGAPGTARGEEGIHLEPGRGVSFPWNVSDALGYRWDIGNNGIVGDGTDDAYDGGMQLQVNNNSFPGQSSARLSKDGQEIEIGPWQQDTLTVWRRVHVNRQAGYCRWVDIFENSSGSNVTLSVRYYSNLGGSPARVLTSSGNAEPGEKDWAVVTADQGDGSRPALVHVLSCPNAKVRPVFQCNRNNDDVYVNVTLTVPAGKAAALCLFEAQRRGFAEAGKVMKDFQPAREVRSLPADLRRILVNVAGPSSMLGEVELRRNEQADLLVLRTGDEIVGEILNDRYDLRTAFGPLSLPAGKVVGLLGVSPDSDRAQVVTTDGQVVAGELAGEVRVKLSGGGNLNIPPRGLIQAAYRVTPAKPAELAGEGAMVALRSGERLAVEEAGMTLEFLSVHGRLALAWQDLASIEMDTPAGGLHRAVFRNGSTLAGLLATGKMTLKLRLGPSLDISPAQVRRLQFTAPLAEPPEQACLVLRNTDELRGEFTDANWELASRFGKVTVACKDIAEAEFPPEALGQVRVTLRDGSKLGGQLVGQYVNFQVRPGPAVRVFVGHLAAAKGAPAPAAPESTTRPQPGTRPTDTAPSAEGAARTDAREHFKAEVARLEKALGGVNKTIEVFSQAPPPPPEQAEQAGQQLARLMAERNRLLTVLDIAKRELARLSQ